MKKILQFILSGLLILCASVNVRADVPPTLTVAVYDFTATSETQVEDKATHWNASLWNAQRETAHDIGPNVTALVTADLAAETNLALVERSELSKALSEQAFGISGMVSSDAAAKIGKITGAKVLVAGQVIKDGADNHLVIVADVIGTETGRLFADKVEGPADNLSKLTFDLSEKISQTISTQATNLVAAAVESHDQLLERIIKSINGTNRPSVSLNIFYSLGKGRHAETAEAELGLILLKSGFAVVDDSSDRKPDIEITGIDDTSAGSRQGELFSYRAVIQLKIQERRTGDIIGFDHQESTATDAAKSGADKSSQINAVDALAERILPLLAK
jgi:hypothetical protein